MTAFIQYVCGGSGFCNPNNAVEAYNNLQGLRADGLEYPFGATGGTRFVHPGDPNKDTGPNDTEYVDSDNLSSGDRQFLMSSGPFNFAPGDSQEVVYAIFMAADGEPLDSYLKLKEVDKIVQRAYDANFNRGKEPPAPQVQVTELSSQIILTWDDLAEQFESINYVDTYPTTSEPTKYIFEGYNIYQVENADGSGEIAKITTFDRIKDVKIIMDDVFDENYGVYVNVPVQKGADSGIKRSINITHDYLRNTSFINNRAYHFIVTAYSYNEYGWPKTLESSKNAVISVRPQIPTTWQSRVDTIDSGNQINYGYQIQADHIEGNSSGSVYVKVVDPTKVTGDEYEIFFQDEKYYRDVDGIWKNVNSSGKEALQKILDCSGSMITVAALASATIGTYDLTFNFAMDCGSNWVDGIMLDFPDDIVINNWEQVGDCSNGAAAGQNCVNMEGTLDATTNSITWGDDARSGFGMIEGNQTWVVNIQPADFPINVGYSVYDDVYDGTQVDAVGTATASELAYDMVTIEGWYARNLDSEEIITPHTTIQNGYATQNVVEGKLIPAHDAGVDANPIAEGLQIIVNNIKPDIDHIAVVANAAGPLEPPVDGLPYWRYPDWLVADGHYDEQQSTTDAIWMFNTHPTYGAASPETFHNSILAFAGGYDPWHFPMNTGISALIPDDFELRFTGNGRFFDNWGDGWFSQPAPFEVWNIGSGIPDDTSDDYQLITWLLDDDGDGKWGLTAWDHESSSGDNDPCTDRVYVHAPLDDTPGTQGHDNWWANLGDGSGVAPWHGRLEAGGPLDSYNVFSRTVFMNWNGGDVANHPNYNALEPETGTVFRITTTKPNSSKDKFIFSTAALVGKMIEYNPSNINVWPNPYFAFNPEETSSNDRQIHFTNLPESGKCIIRIFDLAGKIVRKLDHTNGSQYEIWNVRDYYSNPVASGMYIVHIETDNGEKILKLAVVQPD